MADVFISYARSDRERAKALAEALEQEGYSVWWDFEIAPGDRFSKVIQKELDEAKSVIVLWSKESVESRWVESEATEGERQNKLVPAMIDDVAIPLPFRQIHTADLTDWEEGKPHSDFTSLLKKIAAIVARPPVSFYPKPTDRQLCILVIVHSKSSPGAINRATGVTDFDFNEDLAKRIERKVKEVAVLKISNIAYKELADHINLIDPDFAIALQCNAYDGRAHGTEVLFEHSSKIGSEIARILKTHLVSFLGLSDRGTKPTDELSSVGYFLTYTKVPCVVSRAFFIDNDNDLARASEDLEGLAAAFASAIDEISQCIEKENEIEVSP